MKQLRLLVILLIIGISGCNSQNKQQTLAATEFSKMLQETKEATLIDVRTAGEFAGGAIQGAKNVDYRSGNFESEIMKLDKNKPYFIYCLSGGRSSSAANFMRSNGFNEVYDLQGGIMAWQAANLPMGNVAADKITMKDLTDLTTTNSVVLVDFYAPWCGPCMKMEPMLEQLTKEYEGKVKIVRFNVDEGQKMTQELGILEIPHFKLYKQGKETWSHTGMIEKTELKGLLN